MSESDQGRFDGMQYVHCKVSNIVHAARERLMSWKALTGARP